MTVGDTGPVAVSHDSAPDWLPWTAEQVRQWHFPETRRRRVGYETEAVDQFLSRVALEIERWTAAHATAMTEIHRLRSYFRTQRIDPDVRPTRELSTESVRLLARAQADADRLIADAQAHARLMQQDARSNAEAIVARARAEAEKAAEAYRQSAGSDYTPDREQAERLVTLARNILAALGGASTQLDGASSQMRAITDAFARELLTLSGPAALYPPDDDTETAES